MTTSSSDSDFLPEERNESPSPRLPIRRRTVGRRRGTLIQLRRLNDLSVLAWFDQDMYMEHMSDERHWLRMGQVQYDTDGRYICVAVMQVSPFLKRVMEWKLDGYPFDFCPGPIRMQAAAMDDGRTYELIEWQIAFRRRCWRWDLRETIMGDIFDMLLRVGNYSHIFDPVHRFVYGAEPTN